MIRRQLGREVATGQLSKRGAVLAQVSSELIRVSILWHEMWHEALEEASRLYFGEQNVEGMLGVLLPLHEKIEQEQAVTLKEISFVQVCMSWASVSPAFRCRPVPWLAARLIVQASCQLGHSAFAFPSIILVLWSTRPLCGLALCRLLLIPCRHTGAN